MNHLRLGPSYYVPTDVAVTDEVAIDGVEPPVTQAATGDGIGFRAHMEIQEVLNNITTLQEWVIWRKKSYGTRSDRGKKFVERITSIAQTIRKQSGYVLRFVQLAVECFMQEFLPL